MNAPRHPPGRPPELPLCADVAEFNLPLEFVRTALERERVSSERTEMQGRRCIFNHGAGAAFGKLLAGRMATLLHRPGCFFHNSFVWFYGRGDAMPRHTDRSTLDITMSVPLVLDGAETWPVALRQPNGDILEWPSQVGTAFVFDGRWRPHWRVPFDGDDATVLLLHWRAPAVLWSGLVEPAIAARMRTGAGVPPAVFERCAELTRLAVPTSETPTLSLCRSLPPALPTRPDGTRLILPLGGELTVTVADLAPVRLAPGDGVAFPSVEKCELEWPAGGRDALALVGEAETPRAEAEPMA